MTRRDLPPRVPASVLRVFEPPEAFPVGVREELLAAAGRAGADARAEAAERRAAWFGVLRLPVPEDLPEVRVLHIGGGLLLCPASTAVSGPEGGNGSEPATAGGAGSDGRGGCRHTLVRAWDLPVPWLAVVTEADRAGGQEGRYRLPISVARSRAARVLRTLRRHLGDADVAQEAELLARWLETFDARAWLVLDTGPVAALVGGVDGAADVQLGLESLTAGEVPAVAAAYQRLRKRSQRLIEWSVSS